MTKFAIFYAGWRGDQRFDTQEEAQTALYSTQLATKLSLMSPINMRVGPVKPGYRPRRMARATS
jgi:hypothetical protein